MIYPNSNLPTVSQSWGRAIQKGIESLEATIKRNEINNKARDTQLQANYVQTNKNIQDIKFALTNSGIAVTGVNEIKNAIYVPGTTKIDGGSIQTGTLSASTINGGIINSSVSITGAVLKSAATGARVEISGTSLKIDGGSGTVATLYGSGSSFFIAGSGGSFDVSSDGSSVIGGGNSIDVLTSGIVVSGNTNFTNSVNFDSPVDFTDGVDFATSPTFTGASFSSTISTTGISNSGGNITNGGTLSNTGNINSPATYANNVQSGRVMYVASNGTYNCATSSARYKQDINPYVVDVNKFLQLEPVSFRYKMAVEQFGERADIAHGFIAEQAAEVGMDEFVDFEPDENGNLRPDNFRYIDFTAAMYSVIKSQQATIESLTARIEALESKV